MAASVLFSTAIWGAILILVVRVCAVSGLAFGKNNRVIAAVTEDKSLGGGFEAGKRELLNIFLLALLFRLIVFLLSACAVYIFRDKPISFEDFMNEYLKWDANNYQRIAIGGYKYHTENGTDYTTLVFFPLYPWLVRIFSPVFRNEILSGIITSALLYSGGCCYLYKLLSLDCGRSAAVRTLVYISVFPHALFFGVMMNESTLLFTVCAALYYIRTHNWKLAGVFGALAALSRLAGILLVVPAAVEWLEHYEILGRLKEKKIAEVWRLFYGKGLWIFLMLAGVAIYLFCNYKTTGEWFKFLEYEERYWQQKNCYFGSGFKVIFDNLVQSDGYTKFAIWIPGAVSSIFVTAALIYGLRRQRNMYSAFLIAYLIVNAGITWPISFGRYMTCAVPAFMSLSDFSERHRWTEPIITAAMAAAFGIYFVAYFMGRQIL